MSIERGKNGQVERINGWMGKVLAWLRLLLPLVVFVFAAIIIPLNVWHLREHGTIREFMAKGPRVTAVELIVVAQDLRAEWTAALAGGQLPAGDYRLTELEQNRVRIAGMLESLRLGQAAHGERLARIESSLSAVLRLLED